MEIYIVIHCYNPGYNVLQAFEDVGAAEQYRIDYIVDKAAERRSSVAEYGDMTDNQLDTVEEDHLLRLEDDVYIRPTTLVRKS